MQIDTRRLAKRCTMHKPPGKEIFPGLWYTDNGAEILGVAHLDYVPQTTHFATVCVLPSRERVVYSGQLDDRLGVYTLLDVLPQLGLCFDVLLTTDEEQCNSTARFFQTDKVYKWVFSFDRASTRDVALYQYLSDHTSQAVKDAGLFPAHGSYSDIVELEHLECAGFNWCTGLQDGHSRFAHVLENDYIRCVQSFLVFWDLYSDTHFPHTPTMKWYADFDVCDLCGAESENVQYLDGAWKCPECAGIDEKWLDECWCCGNVTTVEYQRIYDAFLCEQCLKMLSEEEV